MSKLQELIDKLCPNGVEWKTLGEIAELKRGQPTTKNTLSVGDIPVISGGKEPSFYCDKPNRRGDIITIAGSGVNAGYIQYHKEPIYVNDAFSIQSNNINNKYLYYYLSSIQNQIYEKQSMGTIPHVYIKSIENFKIPIPPIEVQEEIVRILDKFTELTAELTAELEKRKKQYEYYRDKLLSFNDIIDRNGGGV